MTLAARAWPQDEEREFLDALRARYEAEGFSFTIAPDPVELPEFFRGYRPDAVARKPGVNVAVEVKRGQSLATQQALQDIRRLFEGRSDWRLHVAFMGSDPLQSLAIPRAQPTDIRERMGEVAALDADGHHRAAFLMAWPLLEAALLHALGEEASGKARPLGAVVQALAMNGYIDPETERRMRPLVDLRNRVVHGDLTAEPTAADVSVVLAAIEETLAAQVAA